eukprot:3645993-Amphidinium_carterae.1
MRLRRKGEAEHPFDPSKPWRGTRTSGATPFSRACWLRPGASATKLQLLPFMLELGMATLGMAQHQQQQEFQRSQRSDSQLRVKKS